MKAASTKLTLETSDADPLGLESQDFHWTDLSLCRTDKAGNEDNQIRTSMFYDEYEEDLNTRKIIDDLCLSCPVMPVCLRSGIENAEWGVWGAVYLVRGKPRRTLNSHKSKATNERIKDRLLDDAIYG